jgi:hypothetical protein
MHPSHARARALLDRIESKCDDMLADNAEREYLRSIGQEPQMHEPPPPRKQEPSHGQGAVYLDANMRPAANMSDVKFVKIEHNGVIKLLTLECERDSVAELRDELRAEIAAIYDDIGEANSQANRMFVRRIDKLEKMLIERGAGPRLVKNDDAA